MTKHDICEAIDDEMTHAEDGDPSTDCGHKMETYAEGTFLCTRKAHKGDPIHVAGSDDLGIVAVWLES